jgi:hypothetical protein
LNPSLGVGKDDCLLKVFQDNLVEVLLCSIHLDQTRQFIKTVQKAVGYAGQLLQRRL